MKTNVKVIDAMTKQPIVASSNTSLKDCAKIMSDNKVGSLIIKDNGKLLGIIKERDIVRSAVLENADAEKVLVKDYMIKDVITITPDEDIYDAIVKMRDLDIRFLPVVDNDAIIGLLTVKDILKIQPSLFDLLAEKLIIKEEEDKPIFMRRRD